MPLTYISSLNRWSPDKIHRTDSAVINILFDCERMKYPNTGLYHFCLQLGQALIRNMNPVSENISFYLPARAGKLFGEALNYIDQKSWHKFQFPDLANFDIWHCTYQGSSYKPGSNKIKEVLTIHDLNFLYEHSLRPDKIKRSLKRIQTQIDRADRICAISEYAKMDVQNHLQLHNKKIEVVYNGCNINKIGHLKQPQFLPASPFIFTLGTVTSKKNFHVLPSLLIKNDLLLIITGVTQQKEYKKRIIDEAIKYGVSERVFFTGPVSENDKQWYLQHCEAFVFPSIAEGFGLPVIEAMAFGKPIFLSTNTSLPEIGGETAYYFKSFDADEMLQTFETGMKHYRSNDLAESIRNRAATFNWDHAALKYIEIYRSLYQ